MLPQFYCRVTGLSLLVISHCIPLSLFYCLFYFSNCLIGISIDANISRNLIKTNNNNSFPFIVFNFRFSLVRTPRDL